MSDSREYIVDVGVEVRAEFGERVRVGQFHRQERIRSVFDGLGTDRVGDHHCGAYRRVLICDPLSGGRIVAAEDDAVGVEKVLHCVAFTQEL